MDVLEAIKTRLENREFGKRPVPNDVKREILEAGRLAPSGMNSQHWRFILVEDSKDLQTLAEISTTGKWVKDCDFAIIVLTTPKYPWHLLDAGRTITHMQMAAWNRGVGSRIYTGYDEKRMRQTFAIPGEYNISVVVGFGYPAKKVIGRKNRLPLEQVAYSHRFGNALKL
ncbi:MAG: nitroreductase family protein [Nitrososphaerota archaeon]